MECSTCNLLKPKLYCTKCVKEGVRQQDYQLRAAAQCKDESYHLVKTHLTSSQRLVWLAHAERDEKKVVIASARRETERLQGVIRKGIYLVNYIDIERQRLENLRGDVATRKSNLVSALKGIKASHVAAVTSLKAEISRVRERRESVHQSVAIARRSRCKEAAQLLSLKRISSKEEIYSLAGITLVDFHLIRSTSHGLRC
jgi:hypothetical protein